MQQRPDRPGDGAAAPRAGADLPAAERGEAQQRADARAAARAAAADASRHEAQALQQRQEQQHATAPPSARDPDASLLDIARALLGAAQESAHSAGATVAAFHGLVRADLALAKAATVSGVMMALVAALAAVTTWLLLVVLLVVGLVHAGLPLWGALAVAALATLLVAGGCLLLARHRFGLADMAATRRQWTLLRNRQHGAAQAATAAAAHAHGAGAATAGMHGTPAGAPHHDNAGVH